MSPFVRARSQNVIIGRSWREAQTQSPRWGDRFETRKINRKSSKTTGNLGDSYRRDTVEDFMNAVFGDTRLCCAIVAANLVTNPTPKMTWQSSPESTILPRKVFFARIQQNELTFYWMRTTFCLSRLMAALSFSLWHHIVHFCWGKACSDHVNPSFSKDFLLANSVSFGACSDNQCSPTGFALLILSFIVEKYSFTHYDKTTKKLLLKNIPNEISSHLPLRKMTLNICSASLNYTQKPELGPESLPLSDALFQMKMRPTCRSCAPGARKSALSAIP